jgi:hypothetical protein
MHWQAPENIRKIKKYKKTIESFKGCELFALNGNVSRETLLSVGL